MDLNKLGSILNDMYFNSQNGSSVARIHLFGIKYGKEILESGSTFMEVAIAAKINGSYATEISQGAKLTNYVTVK